MPNTRPWSGGGNATYWGTSMSRITNGTPAVGSVAWWRAGVYPAGSAGHVAYVEKVVSADEIVVSMDSWRGDFSWARITRTSRGWPSGFIHFNDVRLDNTALPKVSGTAKVGSKLTATPGTWNAANATYAYQWLADGAPIQGATGATTTLTQALTGKRVSVRVTASADGYPTASAVSAATAAVQPGVISNTAPPTIAGDPQVDSTLTRSPGRGARHRQAELPVARRRRTGAGATSPTLALDPCPRGEGDQGAGDREEDRLRSGWEAVGRVGGGAAGHADTGERPDAERYRRARREAARRRRGADPAAQGAVQWQRGGTPVPGATGATYRLTSADLGHRVRARVRATRPGYTPLVVRSPWSRRGQDEARDARDVVQPGPNRLTFRATVSAAGVQSINGVVKVRARGKLIRTVRLRDGVASATLTGLRHGARTYRFRVPVTATTQRALVARRVTIRG